MKKEEVILKTAEGLVRTGGYNGFSFRDIAKIVGIKSASVHYHFPTKEDLGAAVAKHYTERFMEALGTPEDLQKQGKNPIEVYVKAFRSALINDKRMCLCGLLGAEINGLPEAVVTETRVFFERNIAWLTRAYCLSFDEKTAEKKAMQALALLEGAMITSNVMKDIAVFDGASFALLEP